MKYLLFTIGLLSVFDSLYGQTDSSMQVRGTSPLHLSVQAMYQPGAVFPTNDFVRGINVEHEPINRFHAFALRIANRTSGEREWERRFLNPRYGLGVYAADFFEAEQIGRPIAVYGFFQCSFPPGRAALL